jgi:inosine-uridine nucleoside N-ribohydrolase
MRSMGEGSTEVDQRSSEFSRYAAEVTSLVLCDVYCMAAMIDNECVLEYEDVAVEIELDGFRSRGSMLMDWFSRLTEKKDAGVMSRVILKLDKNRIGRMIEDAFLASSQGVK